MPNEQAPRQSAIAVVAHCCVGDATIWLPTPSLAAFLQRTLELEPGFLDLFGCFEESGGNLVCVTVWETEADAQRYESRHHSPMEELRWVLETSPGWAAAEVSNAPPHRATGGTLGT
ncbi:MAG: hypothetical protein M3P27_11595 [Acidobacteriota bacterium]|nr:hypothetical protein [Acidobacteriota bacterium]